MKIEDDLQQLNNFEKNSLDDNFKANLRVRLLNQFQEDGSTQISALDMSILARLKHLVSTFFGYLKVQSALNISFLMMSILSFSAVASYFALPSSLKDNLFKKINDVEIISNVEGADVYLNGEYIGKTPVANLNLKSGNYTLRLEKEGYEIYNQSIQISSKQQAKIIAELTGAGVEKSEDDWLAYKNDSAGLSFEYPSSWLINETIESDKLEIKLSKDGLEYILKTGTNLSLGLLNKPEIKTYQREILASDSGEVFKRFLQFDADGSYLKGGLFLSEENRGLIALYNLGGKQEDIIASKGLDTMDAISKSLRFENGSWAQATDNLGEDELIDTTKIPEQTIAQVPFISPPSSTARAKVDLAQNFTNGMYGYSISYPENWDISDSRAYYPKDNSGFSVSTSSGNIEFARLKLRSKESGRLYLLTTYEDFQTLVSSEDICSFGDLVLSLDNGLDLKKANMNSNRYNYQLCSGSSGVLRSTSNTNGVVSYVMYWEISDSEFSANALDEVKAILDSLKFNSSLVDVNLDDIKLLYDDVESSVSFQYPFSWGVLAQASGSQEMILKIANDKKTTLLEISRNSQTRQIPVEFTPNDIYTIKTGQMDLLFQEYYSQNCVEDVCDGKKFEYGLYTSQDLEIVYYQRPVDNRLLLSLLQSLKF